MIRIRSANKPVKVMDLTKSKKNSILLSMNTDRFLQIHKHIHQSFNNREFDQAKTLISEYLELAEQNKSNWNYGNALHQSYTYLGLIALEESNIKQAKEYLILSSNTKGSPQLNSFGPNMSLAKKLLENGESEIVLQYIDACKKFWTFLLSASKIKNWKKVIKDNMIPDFGGHLKYHLAKD